MTLKLTVKPGERFYVGNAQISVQCDFIVTVLIDGDAPVLRVEDHIGEADARTTCQKLQYLVQQMYLSGDIAGHHAPYFELTQALMAEDPAHAGMVAEVNRLLMQGKAYKAVKFLKSVNDPTMTEARARFDQAARQAATH